MRAVVSRHGSLSVEEWPVPEPGEGEVLLKVHACGICGSDLHMLHYGARLADLGARAGSATNMDLSQGVVFGHELSAEIIGYGPNTEHTYPLGTRVCAFPIGISAKGIETIGFSDTYPGGYGQYVRALKDFVIPIPDSLSSDLAALTEPVAVGLHAVEKAQMTPADVPLVIGCGPVGLAVILALKAADHDPIIAADFSPARRAMAEQVGADIVIDPAITSPYSRWTEFSIPTNATERFLAEASGLPTRSAVLFECVGAPGVLQSLIAGAPPQARIICVGVCMETDQIEPYFAVIKQLDVRFVLGYTPEEFARALNAIADGQIDAAPLITDRVGLGGVADAFTRLSTPEDQVKILIDPFKE